MKGGTLVWLVCGLLALGADKAPAREPGLRLVLEVRDRIHREYVDEVDSLRVIDAGLDGLVAGLDAGDNLYRSPTELGAAREPLDDRGQVGLLDEALQRVQLQYLEPVASDSLARGVVRGMLAALDPHSSYLLAAEYEEMVETYRGDFEGIGIYFEVRQGREAVDALDWLKIPAGVRVER